MVTSSASLTHPTVTGTLPSVSACCPEGGLRSLAVSGKGESEDRAAGLASDECSDNPDRADLTDGAIGRKLVPFFGRQLALEGKCNIEYSYGSYLSSSEC